MYCDNRHCNNKAKYLCGNCKCVPYCCKVCQEDEWYNFHLSECKILQKYIDSCNTKNTPISELITLGALGLAAAGAGVGLVTASPLALGGGIFGIKKFREKRAREKLDELVPEYKRLYNINKQIRNKKQMQPLTKYSFNYDEDTDLDLLKNKIEKVEKQIELLKQQNASL